MGVGQHRGRVAFRDLAEISITTPMSCSIIMTVMPNSSLRSTM